MRPFINSSRLRLFPTAVFVRTSASSSAPALPLPCIDEFHLVLFDFQLFHLVCFGGGRKGDGRLNEVFVCLIVFPVGPVDLFERK